MMQGKQAKIVSPSQERVVSLWVRDTARSLPIGPNTVLRELKSDRL